MREKAWRERNRVHVLNYGRQYRESHRSEIAKAWRLWVNNNREKLRDYQRKYAKEKAQRILELQRVRWKKRTQAKRVAHRQRSRIYRAQYLSRIISKLTDAYIRGLLYRDDPNWRKKRESFLRINDFPPEIVEIKRKQIRLLRAIKQRKVNTCTLNTSAA